jgi:hypothetical protein
MLYSEEKYNNEDGYDNKMSRSYESSDSHYLHGRDRDDDDRYIIMSNASSARYDSSGGGGSKGIASSSAHYSSELDSLSSPNARGIALDLSFAAEPKGSQSRSSRSDEPGIQEESLNIVFDLPDGSQGENNFKLGQTVEVLKSFIESEYGIPMNEQTLYLDDKVLQNPFSLLDYPEVKGKFCFLFLLSLVITSCILYFLFLFCFRM